MKRLGDGNVLFGSEVSDQGRKALEKVPNAQQIFENMEDLNSEIKDSVNLWGVEEDYEGPLKEPLKVESKPAIQTKRTLTPSKKAKPQNKVISVTKEQKRQMEKMEDNSLENELDDLLLGVSETEEQINNKQVETKEDPRAYIQSLLDKLGGPSAKDLANLENQYGKNNIHITVFSETEIYIYTHLTRSMWMKSQEALEKLKDQRQSVAEEELKEIVVRHCMIWPKLSLEWKHNSRAGIVGSLFDSIWYNSYFFTPQQVSTITYTL